VEVKLCGGDLHRARAPLPIDNGIDYARQAYKKTKAMRIHDPVKVVLWSEETIEALLRLKSKKYSYSRIAEQLNELFPQKANVKFTKNSVIGKLHRMKTGKKAK
jgi:hypothetical protein